MTCTLSSSVCYVKSEFIHALVIFVKLANFHVVHNVFYFCTLIKAPSSSLCTAILALHGNDKTCGELLLKLCNFLSEKLAVSEEIDNNLIIR